MIDGLPHVEMSSTARWASALDLLEAALATGDAELVAAVDVSGGQAPVPDELLARFTRISDRLAALEADVERRLEDLAKELDRATPREWHAAPPAPSQLDCSA